MASTESTYLPHIEAEKLKPGLQFEYLARAEKGGFGDFPGRFPFELHGKWLIKAAITDDTEIKRKEVHGGITTGTRSEELIAGHEALFRVFSGEDDDEPLQIVSGVILPRPTELKRPEWFGTYPLEQGYSTILGRVMINGEKPVGGMRLVIPARNIARDSLRITGGEGGSLDSDQLALY